MIYIYVPLAFACFALAIFGRDYREFAVAGGLFVVADALSPLWPQKPTPERKPPQV